MFKLIRLEWKKNNVWKYIRNAVIVVAFIIPLILGTARELEGDEVMASYGQSMMNLGIEIFMNMCFIVFTGVMLSYFIVSDYENKTMSLMFSYPIRRWKVMVSKMLAVWIFNFIAMAAGKLLVCAVVVLTREYTHIAAESIRFDQASLYLQILINSALMVSVSFLALPVGLAARSSKAAIVASVVIVCFTQGQIGEFTLSGNLDFYILLIALAAVSVFLSLWRIEMRDVG